MVLPLNMEYIVIGDVHGCIDELKTLLAKQNFYCNSENLLELNTDNKHKAIILLGDFIDKGSNEKLKETIEFLHKNYYHLNKEERHLYLILGMMSLIDATGGFIIELNAARRDINIA